MTQVNAIKSGFKTGGLAAILLIAIGAGAYFGWQKWGKEKPDTKDDAEEQETQTEEQGSGEEVAGEETVEDSVEPEEINYPEPATEGKYMVKVFFSNLEKEAEEEARDIRAYAVDRYTDDDAVATFGLEQMLLGPSAEEKTDGYYTALIVEGWEEGDELPFEVYVSKGTAYVNFTKPLTHAAEDSPERLVKQIESTLKQFETVNDVVVKVEGVVM